MPTNRSEWAANVALQPPRYLPRPALPLSALSPERARKAIARRRMKATLNAVLAAAALIATGISFI